MYMNNYILLDAISCLDMDLLANHLEQKERNRNKAKNQKKVCILKWSGIAAACCLVLIMTTFVIQYIPVTYDLDYSYVGMNGEDAYVLNKNVWIYYVDGSNIKRERVNLPCSAKNVFLTWKHLNDIGDDVALISYEIDSNGMMFNSSFDGENVDNYRQGNYFVLNITVSKNIEDYIEGKDYDSLITSLKRSMSEYSNIAFYEVNILFK